MAAGALLGSTGAIGPFLVPALLLLGLSPSLARGTTLVSELLITAVSLLGHRKAGNLDRRVILAFLPGVATVALGGVASVEVPMSVMTLLIGIFVIVIGITTVYFAAIRANEDKPSTAFAKATMGKLMTIAVFAGFAKGFLGAGWGPIGVGLFVLMGIDARLVIGSSLLIRLLLDVVGGATYAYMNLVDINAVIILTLAGCVTCLLGVRLTRLLPEKYLRTFLGVIFIILGALVLFQI